MKKKDQGSRFMMIAIMMAIAVAMVAPIVQPAYVLGTNVNVQLLNQDPDPVEPGKYVELRWKVVNNGGEAAKDFIFELKPKYPFSLDPGTDARQALGKLDSYQIGSDAYVVYYKVKVDHDAVDSDYMMEYRYSTDGGDSWREKSDTIRVEDNDYNIGIQNVKTIPSKVSPGENLQLSLDIENLASSEISDVRVALTLEKVDSTASGVIRTELPFSPLGTTDEKVVGNIKAGDTKTVNFNLAVDAEAESKVHKLPVTIYYYNIQGTSYSKETTLGVTVFEEPDYLLNLESTDIYLSDQRGQVIASISNTGVSQINFLTIEIEDSEDYSLLSAKKIYLGNLDSDDFETADFDIYMDSDKDLVPVNLRLHYEDEYNNEYDKEEVINIQLYSQEEAIKFGLTQPKSYTGTIVIVVIILLVAAYFIRRRMKRRK